MNDIINVEGDIGSKYSVTHNVKSTVLRSNWAKNKGHTVYLSFISS